MLRSGLRLAICELIVARNLNCDVTFLFCVLQNRNLTTAVRDSMIKEFIVLLRLRNCTAQPTEVYGPHLHSNYTGLLTELNDFCVIIPSARSVLRSY